MSAEGARAKQAARRRSARNAGRVSAARRAQRRSLAYTRAMVTM